MKVAFVYPHHNIMETLDIPDQFTYVNEDSDAGVYSDDCGAVDRQDAKRIYVAFNRTGTVIEVIDAE